VPPPLRRGTFVAAGTAFAAFPARARAQAPATIRIGASADASVIAALYGQQSGIFPKLGLTVEVTRANSGSAVSAAVLGGSLEMGKSSLFGIIEAHVRGVPLILEAGASLFASNPPTAALLVAKDSPIHTGRDLNGKTIAVAALNDLFAIASLCWIDENGGDSRTLKFLELPPAATADAIASGRVDAATLAVPEMTDAVAAGKCRVLGDSCGAVARRFLATAYITSTDYAAKNPDVLARFRKGIAQATAYANAHWTEMLPAISKYTGSEMNVLQATPRDQLTTSLAGPLIQPLIDAAAKYKAIAAAFPARDLIDANAVSG
jgi:NitT/TauT family transport system substrate-binding protein